MTPSDFYDSYLEQKHFQPDPGQQEALARLDRLHRDMVELDRNRSGSLWSRISERWSQPNPPRGVYLWGGVGRGKTFLMDVFFESVPIQDKLRLHFHQFMKQIHDQLSQAPRGTDPLRRVAGRVIADSQLLCLDEFVVTDIGDAMLIGRLLKSLFDEGVVMVMTSNTPPQDLYKDGLQRANFVPAIEQILERCEIYNLDGATDYRMLGLKNTRLYQYPHDAQATRRIREDIIERMVAVETAGAINLNQREIRYEMCAEDTIWFSFEQLCKTARSRLDYLEIAQSYGTLVLTGIEQMEAKTDDVARRFISLIDSLYDHRVKLICTAAVAYDHLYIGEALEFEFRRTASRLREMQSDGYFHQQHRI
jgi:cell division protein ZapE